MSKLDLKKSLFFDHRDPASLESFKGAIEFLGN